MRTTLPAVFAVCCSVAGCHDREVPPGFQGIVEYDDRQLGFELTGLIAEMRVERGQLVDVGQVLARLDDALERPERTVRAAELAAAEAQLDLLLAGTRREKVRQAAAQLDAARATVDQAERNYERSLRLVAAGAWGRATAEDLAADLQRARAQVRERSQRLTELRNGSRGEEIAAAEARVDAADAALAAIERRLERYTLYAPLDGEVLDVVLRPGEIVLAGAPALLVADTAHPFVDVFVPEGELGGIGIGTRARVSVDGIATRLPGAVEYVAPDTEFTPRFLFSERERPNLVIRVRVRIADPQRALHAGVPAFVTFDGVAP